MWAGRLDLRQFAGQSRMLMLSCSMLHWFTGRHLACLACTRVLIDTFRATEFPRPKSCRIVSEVTSCFFIKGVCHTGTHGQWLLHVLRDNQEGEPLYSEKAWTRLLSSDCCCKLLVYQGWRSVRKFQTASFIVKDCSVEPQVGIGILRSEGKG